MKHSFVALVTLALFSIGMIGCGEDDTPTQQINYYLKFNTGDKFTYNYYPRDASNARVEGSKEVRQWTVIRNDHSLNGRTGVAEIQQIRLQADGTTAIDTTMVYFLANDQGQLQQYNLPQLIIAQFSSATVNLQPVIDQISNTWIQVSDTKSPSALSWFFPEMEQTLNDIDILGVATLDAKLKMSVTSSHKGKISTTVPAGTYADAFVTDHDVPTQIIAAEDKAVGAITIDNGETMIQQTMNLHYAVSITGGILSMAMDSKTATVIPANNLPYPINGFEMELTSVTRAAAN